MSSPVDVPNRDRTVPDIEDICSRVSSLCFGPARYYTSRLAEIGSRLKSQGIPGKVISPVLFIAHSFARQEIDRTNLPFFSQEWFKLIVEEIEVTLGVLDLDLTYFHHLDKWLAGLSVTPLFPDVEFYALPDFCQPGQDPYPVKWCPNYAQQYALSRNYQSRLLDTIDYDHLGATFDHLVPDFRETVEYPIGFNSQSLNYTTWLQVGDSHQWDLKYVDYLKSRGWRDTSQVDPRITRKRFVDSRLTDIPLDKMAQCGFDYKSPKHVSEEVAWHDVAWILPHLLSGPKQVLELGIGNGIRLRTLARWFPSSQFFGTEVKWLVETDTPNVVLIPPGIPVSWLNLKADVVYTNMVLHHVTSAPKFIRDVVQSMALTGIFLCREHIWDGTREMREYLRDLHLVFPDQGHCSEITLWTPPGVASLSGSVGLIPLPHRSPIEDGPELSVGGNAVAGIYRFVRVGPELLRTIVEHDVHIHCFNTYMNHPSGLALDAFLETRRITSELFHLNLIDCLVYTTIEPRDPPCPPVQCLQPQLYITKGAIAMEGLNVVEHMRARISCRPEFLYLSHTASKRRTEIVFQDVLIRRCADLEVLSLNLVQSVVSDMDVGSSLVTAAIYRLARDGMLARVVGEDNDGSPHFVWTDLAHKLLDIFAEPQPQPKRPRRSGLTVQ